MNEDQATAKVAIDVPIWDRAHRTLNDMRDSLLSAREQAEQDGQLAANRIAAINEALNRIAPPPPTPAAYPVSGIAGNAVPMTGHAQRPW